jgi:hypothetical protein
MYYTNAQQGNTNDWNHNQADSGWSNDWNDQTDRYQAQLASDNQIPGWQSFDAQDDGDYYKVHMRDGDGHFKTVLIDHHFKAMRTIDGYC